MIGRNEFNRLVDEVDDKAEFYPDGYQPPPVIWQPEAESGLNAYYFSCELKDGQTNVVTVSNMRYRYGDNQGTLSNADLNIPAVDGTYYIYFMIYYNLGYIASINVSAVDTHPDQSKQSGSYYAWRNEVCAAVVVGGIISDVTQIHPGGIMAVEGRVV